MSKLKIILVISLVILAVIVVRVLFWPLIGGGQQYSEVSRESLLRTENSWVLQFDIMNHEGEDRNYTINISVDGEPATLDVSIRDGGAFTYIKHIYPNMFTDDKGQVSITIFKEGEATPFEETTYHLSFD